MFSCASSFLLTVALSAGTPETTTPVPAAPLAAAVSAVSLTMAASQLPASAMGSLNAPRWMNDRPARPRALPALYASLGVLQALDVYSTRRALGAGAREVNPLMRSSQGNTGAMLAVKALSTAGSIYFSERAWKKNRKGAILLMTIVNGVTAAVVANNLNNAR